MQQVGKHAFWVIIVFILTYMPLWHKLAAPAIYIWDEASYANNALEMAMNGDLLVVKNNGQPSLYNVKPPLVIWLEAASIKLFGAGEWAVRFPSALAGLLTCLVVFFFAKRHFNALTGVLAVLFLATTEGFARHHMTRTGDLDSVLIFFIASYTLLFIDYLLDENQPTPSARRLWLMGFLVFGAFMSKSVAGFMPLLGLFLATIAIGKWKALLTNKYLYISAMVSMGACVGYYAIRGMAQEGYLEKVWISEYARFTQNNVPWLAAPWHYYFTVLYGKLYKCYIWLLPFTFILLKAKERKAKQLFIIGMIYCVTLLLLLSYPFVKLDWYIAPIYPVLSLILACFVQVIVSIIQERLLPSWNAWAIGLPLAALIFTLPNNLTIQRISKVDIAEDLEREGHAIRELSQSHPEFRTYKLLMPVEHEEHLDAANFYIKSLNHFKGYDIRQVADSTDLTAGDTVLCSQNSQHQKLREQYQLDTLVSLQHGQLLVLK